MTGPSINGNRPVDRAAGSERVLTRDSLPLSPITSPIVGSRSPLKSSANTHSSSSNSRGRNDASACGASDISENVVCCKLSAASCLLHAAPPEVHHSVVHAVAVLDFARVHCKLRYVHQLAPPVCSAPTLHGATRNGDVTRNTQQSIMSAESAVAVCTAATTPQRAPAGAQHTNCHAPPSRRLVTVDGPLRARGGKWDSLSRSAVSGIH